VGELAQAALQTRFCGPAGGVKAMREEAIQVAAVALSIAECLDRGRWRWGGHRVAGAHEEVTILEGEELRVTLGPDGFIESLEAGPPEHRCCPAPANGPHHPECENAGPLHGCDCEGEACRGEAPR